jgi:hypothetical protein
MEITGSIDINKLRSSRNLGNYVYIDVGDTHGDIREHVIGDTKIYLVVDQHFSGFSMLKRSGKVLLAPEKLKYYKPYELKERVDRIIIKQDDIVFFEPETKSICEQQGYKPTSNDNYLVKGYLLKTTAGTTVYVANYHLMICAIDGKTNELKMVNGKVLVKRREELTYGNTNIQRPDNAKFSTMKSNWVDIVSCNEDEGYQGVFYMDELCDMTLFRQPLEVGMKILIKKMASFDIQSAIKENKDIEALQNTYVVSRHNIMAVKQGDLSVAYGLYLKVEEIVEEEEKSPIINPNEVKTGFKKGKVISVGCGVDSCSVGDIILFNDKADAIYDGYKYIHNFWVEHILNE